jgi:hypothetical protein
LVIPAEPPKTPNNEADPRAIGVRQLTVTEPAVKFHVKLLASALAGIARSVAPAAPPEIVAVYRPPGAKALSGVQVAMRPVATSRITEAAVTGVEAGAGPMTVKVAALTARGSIRKPEGTLKVALTVAVGHTPLTATAGEVESTETFADGTAAADMKACT